MITRGVDLKDGSAAAADPELAAATGAAAAMVAAPGAVCGVTPVVDAAAFFSFVSWSNFSAICSRV